MQNQKQTLMSFTMILITWEWKQMWWCTHPFCLMGAPEFAFCIKYWHISNTTIVHSGYIKIKGRGYIYEFNMTGFQYSLNTGGIEIVWHWIDVTEVLGLLMSNFVGTDTNTANFDVTNSDDQLSIPWQIILNSHSQ